MTRWLQASSIYLLRSRPGGRIWQAYAVAEGRSPGTRECVATTKHDVCMNVHVHTRADHVAECLKSVQSVLATVQRGEPISGARHHVRDRCAHLTLDVVGLVRRACSFGPDDGRVTDHDIGLSSLTKAVSADAAEACRLHGAPALLDS